MEYTVFTETEDFIIVSSRIKLDQKVIFPYYLRIQKSRLKQNDYSFVFCNQSGKITFFFLCV